MPAATNDGPSVALSFANNFWGKDDAGVVPLLERMHGAKQTCDELKSFYSARASIEDEYSRKLMSLCRKSLGSQESGSLKNSLDTVRGELESMAKQHASNAAQMKSELEEPLAAFAGAMKERRKIVQNGIEKLLKIKIQQTQHVNKTRDRYEQECLKIKGYLAQGHMVMGQEERKNKAKLEKTQISLATSNTEYEHAVKALEDTTARWNREWKAAADKFQDLEEERLDFTKSSLWTFANIASTVCVSDDASCEKIRLSLEKLDVEKDISTFINDRGTGQEIPDPPKYINFCRGDVDSQSEASEDDSYSVAQFPRSINPAFRSSSPQPSTFESHHDPNSALARELGHGSPGDALPGTPPSREQTLTPGQLKMTSAIPQVQDRERDRKPRQAPPPQQPKQLPYDPNDFAPVPHDPYPMDGMTMLCRTKPGSDLGSQIPSQVSSTVSSQPASARPSSRDSHSDYSNPTSFTSQDPPSGKVSPVKQQQVQQQPEPAPLPMVQHQQQQPPQMSPEKGVLKKKSGFFQNHSPFRRKSTKEPQHNQVGNRNTWAPSSQAPLMSPTRGQVTYGGDGGRGGSGSSMGVGMGMGMVDRRQQQQQPPPQQQNLLAAAGSPSPEPDPIDANASLALNVGQNVFAVSTPAGRQRKDTLGGTPQQQTPEDDPIAMALAELKGIPLGKQSSVRVSADHYHGISTPAPGAQPGSFSRSMPTPQRPASDAVSAAMRGTPPPSYDQQITRLGVPPQAVTSKAMKETSKKFVNQTRSMFSPTNGGGGGMGPSPGSGSVYGTPTRPGGRSRGGTDVDVPRAASPAPPRSASPQPGSMADTQMLQQRSHRSVSPNPYGGSPSSRAQSRHRQPPQQQPPQQQPPQQQQQQMYHQRNSSQVSMNTTPRRGSEQQDYYRQNSPGYGSDMSRAASRAASPSPSHFRGSVGDYGSPSRPGSSHPEMAMQLAPAPDDGYGSGGGGSMRGRGGGVRPGTASGSREMLFYEGAGPVQPASRTRSKSVASDRQYSRDGRPIMHFARAMYVYQAAIPEELGFAKGDVLAVLRHQDDGWWEAEVHGGTGQVGLVPSNYLQPF